MSNVRSGLDSLSGMFGFDFDELETENPAVAGLLKYYAADAMSDAAQANVPAVGYQGKIPKYTAVRNRMPVNYNDPDRRPGSGGRNYFTDVFYGEREDDALSPRAFGTVAEAQAAADAQAGIPASTPVTDAVDQSQGMAAGGLASMNKGYYLGGKTDGMADEVPANIDGVQEARLSDGEFVIPADVVSHLGNGNSDAGAQQLHNMMDGVRQARTGNPEQGKQIDPQKFMPKMAQGGLASFNMGGNVNAVQGLGSVYKNQPYTTNFQGQGTDPGSSTPPATTNDEQLTAGDTTTDVNMPVGTESSLSNWAGDYVTDMLGQGKALAEMEYESYGGPLTAGASDLQDTAFTSMGNLADPTADMGTSGFTADTFNTENLQTYMNPYTDTVINRTAADMSRQNQIQGLQDRTALTQAGAFGGSRDALMRAESASNLSRNIGDMSAEQRAAGFDRAAEQFGLAQDRGFKEQEAANQYGLDALRAQQEAGATQQALNEAGVQADYDQFKEQRDYPYKQVQYMHSLLQGMPVQASTTSYTQPSDFDSLVQGDTALAGFGAMVGTPSTSDQT
jgi:hypothetical protein